MKPNPLDSPDKKAAPVGRTVIALCAVLAVAAHLLWRALTPQPTDGFRNFDLPLLIIIGTGGFWLVVDLIRGLFHGRVAADLLAAISIITSVILGEYLAGTLVVLMLSSGEALEAYAVRRASSALAALARRMPSVVHLKRDGKLSDLTPTDVVVGDQLVVFPHEICPVDGTVIEGHGVMDESYLTGEPWMLQKAPGSIVLSGSINGDSLLTIRADQLAEDSRYAKIMRVMREAEQNRPSIRRLGDKLGAWYTPFAVLIGIAAWVAAGDPVRFLAVLVVATPCPLIIAIPTAILGAVSLAARRGIVVKDPAILESLDKCRTAIFDKTGTLTYGRPAMTELLTFDGFSRDEVLRQTASIERYSRHPLAGAFLEAATNLPLLEATRVSEPPGLGLVGDAGGHSLQITGRTKLATQNPELAAKLPPTVGGLECVILIDGRLAGLARFRDRPRVDGKQFINHLGSKHGVERVLLVSGDRENEVRWLAEAVGIEEVHAECSPETKVEIARRETAKTTTFFVGDGINDAPALTACTVGLAFGRNSDVTAEAAGAVILESDLRRVDELLHIAGRFRRIALQSAVGGMALSAAGMLFAAFGFLPPAAGAVAQEAIDVLAVVNALRVGFPTRELSDY